MVEVVTRVMVVDMVNNKVVAMAANKAVMGGMGNAIMNAVTNAEMTIHMDSSKAGATAANKAEVMAEANKAGVMAEVNKAGVMEEGSKTVAMAEVNKADMAKVAVVATALKIVLVEGMEGEGISFKKVEDQVTALEVISTPTKL
jgi:hypothetical protein